MSRPTTNTKHRRESTRRRAVVAKIETALALLVVAAAVIFAVVSVTSAHSHAKVAPRSAAAAKKVARQHKAKAKRKTARATSPKTRRGKTTASASRTPAHAATNATTAREPKVRSTASSAARSRPTRTRAAAKTTGHQRVVVIDAGHQGKADLRLEPVGPGGAGRKPRVAGGTSGVATHKPESIINLQVALRLREALMKRGVKVIMIRTSQNVDIANSQRAKIANAAHADLFIRLHCDGVTDSSTNGFLTLVPAKNAWTNGIVTASARAGRDVQAASIKATSAKNRGITGRNDMSGFNWSKVPSVIVEMGVMTNPAEDRRLSTASYQTKLASGMTNGIVRFLSGK